MHPPRWSLAALTGLAFALSAEGAEPPEKPQPRPADSDAPMAEGWPKATEAGAVEVKRYPAYRSAVARAKGASLGADNVLFFPLFNHISKKGVAMTTPVVNTYAPAMLEEPGASGELSMEFVYRTTTQGETGQGVGAVKVEDHPAKTYVCLGHRGPMGSEVVREGVKTLHAWLDKHKDAWAADGPPRRLGYHGPMTPEAERLWEIQVPVKPAKDGKDTVKSS